MDSTKNREWSNTISSALLEAGSVLEPIGQNVQLMTCTMADLQAFGPYDFVSIDAEWEDMEILKVIPEEMLRSWKLLSIEPREGQSDEMTALLIKRGMKQVYRTPENILCAQA